MENPIIKFTIKDFGEITFHVTVKAAFECLPYATV